MTAKEEGMNRSVWLLAAVVVVTGVCLSAPALAAAATAASPIGFWKNSSSCTSGGQAPTLDATLGFAANAGTPVTIGILVLDPNVLGKASACTFAVNLLNKSRISTGTKMASDPLFNMAAQLLGADLNLQAGAAACASAVSVINQAQALLLKYLFDGNGYSPRVTSTDAMLASQLAANLETYNNNLFC